MKSLLILALTVAPVFAQAFECHGTHPNGEEILVKATTYGPVTFATVDLQIGAVNYQETTQLEYFHQNTMGQSRCPGVWSGITFKPQAADASFKSFSVVTKKHFYGCGVAPSHSIALEVNGQQELVSLACEE